MMLFIYCIVEGHGEETAYPRIILNILNSLGRYDVKILHPYRLGKDHFNKDDKIAEVVQYGWSRISAQMEPGDTGLVVVSRDSDELCPVELRKAIEDKIGDVIEPDRFAVVICKREFEAWFLAGSESFAGHQDCRDPVPIFEDPESFADPKGRFERDILKEGRYYSETVDQQKFASLLNFELKPQDRSRSLRRLVEVLSEYV